MFRLVCTLCKTLLNITTFNNYSLGGDFMKRSYLKRLATLSMSAALVAGLGVTAVAGATTPPAQAALTVTNASLNATALQNVTVTYSGGSGTGAVTLTVTGTGCSLSGTGNTTLTDTQAGKCVVTVAKSGGTSYKDASVKAIFTFAAATQATLTVSNTTTGLQVNTPITLTAAGGSGSGALKFSLPTGGINTAVCKIKDGAVTAKTPGSCAVEVTKAKTATYAAATSAPVTLTFAYTNATSSFSITNTGPLGNTASGAQAGILTSVGTKVAITTTGGSGTGKVSYAATTVAGDAGACVVSKAGSLSATGAAVCAVTATLGAQGVYGPQTSAAQDFIFQPLADVITLVTSGTTKSSISAYNNTANGVGVGGGAFIDSYYAPADHWYQAYINSGSSNTLVFLVTNTKGQVQKSTDVTLVDGLGFSKTPGTDKFSAAGLNSAACSGACTDGVLTGTTNSLGLVTFTLANTNVTADFASTTLKPNDTTGANATADEQSGLYPWNRFVVVVGKPAASAVDALFTENLEYNGGTPSVTQATDLVDLITVPTTAKTAQAPLVINNTVTSADNGGSITVAATGGSGTGGVTYAVSTVQGTGCAVSSSGVVSVTGSGSAECAVTVTKAADSNYGATTSAPVNFIFGTVDQPTVAHKDVATLTSVTGITGNTLDDSVAGASEFINQFFNAGDHWSQSYLAEGAAVTENWHVVGSNGQPLKFANVTLWDNQAYSLSKGTTWSNTALNVNTGNGLGGSLTGTTDASGNVSFTLTNTNTETGTAPTNAELTTTGVDVSGNAVGAELYEKTAPLWTRTYLQVGSDVISNGGTQNTDLVDLIVIPATPTVTNPCASATSPTNACPDVATLTSVSGGTGSQLDNSTVGYGEFLDQYFMHADHWYLNYIVAGSTVTETWHVAKANGSAAANTAVTLIGNLDYSKSTGTTWQETALDGISTAAGGPNGPNGELQGTISGTTDANGDVTFTLHNTNTATGYNPSDMTTAAGAALNEGPDPWTRTTLQVGSDTFNALSGTNTEVTDLVDLIVVSGTPAPCSTVTGTNACPDVATLTSVSGGTGSQLDNSTVGYGEFLDQYFMHADHWYLNYIVAGSTVTETWHVAKANGSAAANTAVTLIGNLDYSKSTGTTWQETALDGISTAAGGPNGPNGELQGTISGTTDANGDVTFTLHNTNTATGYNPSDMTTAAGAALNEGPDPWTRTTLQVGSDTFNALSGTNTEVTDLVDLIVIPQALS